LPRFKYKDQIRHSRTYNRVAKECVNLSLGLTGALYFEHLKNTFKNIKKLKKYQHIGNDILYEFKVPIKKYLVFYSIRKR
jgi:hypothetical protein